uniref:Core Histone H2A/H2B/H3 domain-containing protein n=1 Tax=viral metagenome TaxID=1070528 RepID=A0A6C0BMG9_9ZZZZ
MVKSEQQEQKVRRRKQRNTTNFNAYIYKVLKNVHPEHGISKKAMSVMNGICSDLFERIGAEAARVSRYNNRRTLSSKEIQTATRLILPGELSKHAVSAGIQSVTRFNSN